MPPTTAGIYAVNRIDRMLDSVANHMQDMIDDEFFTISSETMPDDLIQAVISFSFSLDQLISAAAAFRRPHPNQETPDAADS